MTATQRRSPHGRVSLCSLTFKRPETLAPLIGQLINQAESVQDLVGDISILIVDNDPAASARDAVLAASEAHEASSITVRYEHEPEPGISAARNKALASSIDFQTLVFIDDDEEPQANWLMNLLKTRVRYDAQAASGPVVPRYESRPSPYILDGEFFVRPTKADGSASPAAATNNLLLDLDFVRQHGLRFDPELGLIGGEDTLFTKTIVKRGGTIRWCADAVVVDLVPTDRMTREWVLRRRYRFGTTAVLVDLKLADTSWERLGVRAKHSMGALVDLTSGALGWVRGYLSGSTGRRAKSTGRVYRGAGRVAGVLGRRVFEYRR